MFPDIELTAFRHPVLITDQLAAPADFLLHRTITAYLKDGDKNHCILLSMSSDLSRWKTVSAKHNVNIDQRIKSGSFKFIDLTSSLRPPQPLPTELNSSLRSLFELISNHVDEIADDKSHDGLRGLVVFDDTSSIEWLGHSITDSTRFIRALSSLCRKSNLSLLFRHHVVSPGEPDDLLRHLLQTVAYHIEVRPLSSGKSSAVSGEIVLHPGPTLVEGLVLLSSGSQDVQYRLTDYSAVFFGKGTGGSGPNTSR